jgi:hypothetical protein
MANEAGAAMDQVWYAQSSSKWGVQPGPADFYRSYDSAVYEVASDLRLLGTKLEEYVAAVDKTIETYVESDNDAATQTALTSAQVEQKAKHTQANAGQGTSYAAKTWSRRGSSYDAPPGVR